MATVKGGFSSIVRQAQKMQQQISRVQDGMADKIIEASSGGGRVTAYVNGRQELIKLTIDPEVIDPEDPSMLEDMILAAVGQAISHSQKMVSEEVNKITGGINIPGLF